MAKYIDKDGRIHDKRPLASYFSLGAIWGLIVSVFTTVKLLVLTLLPDFGQSVAENGYDPKKHPNGQPRRTYRPSQGSASVSCSG